MSNLRQKAKIVKSSLGFFIGTVLMLFIVLAFPFIAAAIVLLCVGAISVFLGKQYVEYAETKKRE